ncbi:unnamed protein product [Linum tenue]|uniref:Uncharacterized protein n=1 Tax=Linum tenue TaxID=586396 RepID=A0AAV0S9R7_9ROSI|nr:unnamed protein product [Linum tenue]
MKGASKVIMGATVAMVIGLGFVLTLVLMLLAELYCNLILRRRRHRQQPAVSSPDTTSPPSNLPAVGVLQPPRSFLFPIPAAKEAKRPINSRRNDDDESRHHQLHHVLELYDGSSNASPQQIGLLRTPSPPEIPAAAVVHKDSPDNAAEHFIYISNPIYDNRPPPAAVAKTNSNDGADYSSGSDAPFETPDSSPSRLESDGDEEITTKASPPAGSSSTPPLLPAEATISGSTDSNSNNGLLSSSSSVCTPSTSPSW